MAGLATENRIEEVAARMRAAIDRYCTTPASGGLLRQILGFSGRVFDMSHPATWPLFALETCHALGGDPDLAVDAGVAAELAVVAIDVIDDEWDGDPADLGRAQNASVALHAVAQLWIDQMAPRLGVERVYRMSQVLAATSLRSCLGQDLDLLLERQSDVTEEQSHEMTSLKAGPLVSLACQLGALVATGDNTVLALIDEYSTHLGTVAQITNDLAGVDIDPTGRRSDLQNRKKTLPVAFALRHSRESNDGSFTGHYRHRADVDLATEQFLASYIRDCGGLHYAWVVADAHRHEGMAVLKRIEQVTGRPEVRALRRLMPALRQRRLTPA